MTNLSERQNHYQSMHLHLPGLSHAHVLDCLQSSETTEGWGVNHVVSFQNTPVFVKRIPLTTQEYTRAFDTANHFHLPMYYHYGVGSAGFGAFRELLTHIKCSQWVLSGQHTGFPLLYHYRILPTSLHWKQRSTESLQKHLSFWNQNPEIKNYLAARAQAPYEIMLFLEYFPHNLRNFCHQNPHRTLDLIQQADKSLQFLNQQGVLHLDAHLANLLSDGRQCYVSDFGLALDCQFDLRPEESLFFKQHSHYDRAELLSGLNILWMQSMDKLPPEQLHSLYQTLQITGETPFPQRLQAVFNHLNPIHRSQSQLEPVLQNIWPPKLMAFFLQHQHLLLETAAFFEALINNPQKDTLWPNPAVPNALS